MRVSEKTYKAMPVHLQALFSKLPNVGSEEVLALFSQSKGQGDVKGTEPSHTGDENAHCYGEYGRVASPKRGGNGGSAARFFYCAKSSRSERGDGNTHTTVKPLALMEYLCKLVSYPVGTLILDPFCGSGTTLVACTRLGLRSIGIDSDEESCKISAKRCALAAVERIKRGEY